MLLTNRFDPDPRVHQEAKSLVKNGYSVTIFCWDRDFKTNMEEYIDDIRVKRIYVRSQHGRGSLQIFFLFLFWCKAFFKLIFSEFDVFHCHDFDTLPLGFLLGKIKNKIIVYDAHESYADMLINVNGFIKKFIVTAENYIVRRIRLLITVGNILKKEFIKRGAKNVCVAGNWKNLNDFYFPDSFLEQEKEKLRIPRNKIIVSFIGWFGYERKIYELIQAVKNENQIFLILGGKGPLLELVKKAAEELDNILYLGFVDPSKISLYTCMSHIIFYGFDPLNPNSKYSAPNKLFEAIAANKPIISGDFGEIGDIIKKYKIGYITDYSEDSFKQIINDIKTDEWQMRFSKGIAEARKKFNWDNAEKELIDSYKRLC